MKRGFNIQINFTNRVLYTFIAFIVLLIIGVGVFALTPGVAPNPGHLITELAPSEVCGTDQVLKWGGSGWTCTDDITTINAGTGLSGGGTSGSINFSGSINLSADTSYLQRRVTSSCPSGSSIRIIDSNGGVTCDASGSGPPNFCWYATKWRSPGHTYVESCSVFCFRGDCGTKTGTIETLKCGGTTGYSVISSTRCSVNCGSCK